MDALRLPAERASIAPFRDFATTRARAIGLDPALLPKVELVIEEAVTNLYMHAYKGRSGEAELRCAEHPAGCVCLQLTDWGPPYDPTRQPAPDTSLPLEARPIGGLGVHLMKHMADRLEYRREDGKNILTICFRIRKK